MEEENMINGISHAVQGRSSSV